MAKYVPLDVSRASAQPSDDAAKLQSPDLAKGRCSTASIGEQQPGCGEYALGVQFGAKLALIDHRALQERASALYASLAKMVERYTRLAGSGDCGNWNPENEYEVKVARAALASCPPTWRVNDRTALNTDAAQGNILRCKCGDSPARNCPVHPTPSPEPSSDDGA